ncbi:MAG: holo-ACP synthase [Candidatus Riflemargulisbacteria bacterium]
MESKYTTGIDVVSVTRFKDILEDEHFKKRVFSDNELEYIFKSENESLKLNRMAARFAAKEAFYKAVPSIKELIMKEVSVKHESDGRPYLFFSGKTKLFVEESLLSFDLSISHDGGLAVATVVCCQAT